MPERSCRRVRPDRIRAEAQRVGCLRKADLLPSLRLLGAPHIFLGVIIAKPKPFSNIGHELAGRELLCGM